MRDADARKWRRLVKEARRVAADPFCHAGDLIAAAKTARRAVAPDSETLAEVASPLIRLAETYGDLSTACRVKAAETMGALGDRLALIVGEPRAVAKTIPALLVDMAERDVTVRKDIYG